MLDEQAIVSKPEYLTYDEAATLPVAALSSWYALIEMGKLKQSEFVLIQGTGGVSLFGLQFASAVGARPIVLSSSDQKLDKARPRRCSWNQLFTNSRMGIDCFGSHRG